MPNSRRKIWDLYDLLSEKEVNVCQAWITASVGGKDAMVSKLFRAMQRDREDKQIWKKLYGTEVYNDNRLRNLFHELGKYLEDYIAFQQFRKAPFLRDLYLIKGINRRGLAESFRYFFRKVKQRWERQPIRNSRYFWALYELEGENFHHASKFPRKEKLDYFRDVEGNLERALNLELLRNTLYSQKNETNQFAQLKSYEEIAKKGVYPHNYLETLYLEIYRFQKDELEISQEFLERFSTIWENRQNINHAYCELGDKAEFLNFAFVVLNKFTRINNERIDFGTKEKQLKYYNWLISNDLLNIEGKLPLPHFRNVITLGLKLEQWNEVDRMMNEYANLLPSNLREESVNLSKGRLFFYQKNFQEALPFFVLSYRYFRDYIIARFYLLQTHYELGKLEDLKYQLSLLKTAIKNRAKRLGKPRLERNLLRIFFFEQLCKATTINEFMDLKEEIIEKGKIASPEWLIEKCDENIEWMRLNKD